MKYLFVTDVNCLLFTMEDYEKNFDGLFNITNKKEYPKQLVKITPLVLAMGKLNFEKIIREPMLYEYLDESFVKRIFGVSSIIELARKYNGMSQTLLNAFWLVKDNSINFNTTFVYDTEKISSTCCYKYICFLCADGSRHKTEFSENEMNEVDKNLKGLLEISDNSENGYAEPINISEVKYNSIGRVDRMLYYIVMARSQSLLPLKITFYIDFLESLMPDDNGELQHKVSEFVAKYVGGTWDEKTKNYKMIKDAYSIRSKFCHGQKMAKSTDNRDYLAMLSNNLDSIARVIMKRIIFSDHTIFSKSSDDKGFREWYLKIVFS